MGTVEAPSTLARCSYSLFTDVGPGEKARPAEPSGEIWRSEQKDLEAVRAPSEQTLQLAPDFSCTMVSDS